MHRGMLLWGAQAADNYVVLSKSDYQETVCSGKTNEIIKKNDFSIIEKGSPEGLRFQAGLLVSV